MRRLLMALALGTGAVAAGGCMGETQGTYAVTASYNQPDLAYVSPGVYAVTDSPDPVFYSDNLYWRYNNGVWYSSNYYNRGWRYSTAPRAVVSIQRPYAYVRYRPSVRYQVRADGRVRVRDHRDGRYYRR